MITENKFFLIPYEDVPERPSYKIWSGATWSATRPGIESRGSDTRVVAFTDQDLPSGAILIAISSKGPPPLPPPPLPVELVGDDFEAYQGQFEEWLAEAGRGGIRL